MIKSFFRQWERLSRKLFHHIEDVRWHELNGRLDNIENILKASLDVEAMPKARGWMRLLQKSDIALLQKVDAALAKHGLQYWIESGTLIGAMRHGGFIPWDDDIDIGMIRDDYRKAEAALKSELTVSDGFTIIRSNAIRVIYKDTPCQIDIFPYDMLNVKNDDKQTMDRLWSEYRKRGLEMTFDWTRLNTDGLVVNRTPAELDALADKVFAGESGPVKVVVPGSEYQGKNMFMGRYDIIFPIKRIPFENTLFSAPADPDAYLLSQYGDYMEFPGKIVSHGDIIRRLTLESVAKMRKLVDDMEVK